MDIGTEKRIKIGQKGLKAIALKKTFLTKSKSKKSKK